MLVLWDLLLHGIFCYEGYVVMWIFCYGDILLKILKVIVCYGLFCYGDVVLEDILYLYPDVYLKIFWCMFVLTSKKTMFYACKKCILIFRQLVPYRCLLACTYPRQVYFDVKI